jgi:calcineurin-like phosphoesterase family protein
MIWFTADSHFGHPGILIHQSARLNAFETVENMDAEIIAQFNSVLRPNDELYHLGDFCWQASRAGHYRQRLNVRKLHIVRGNHDSSSLAKHCSTFNDMLCRKFQVEGREHPVKIHMLHYPMLSWDALHHGGIHLYGHSHGRYEDQLEAIFPGRRAMDVGVDNIYRLYGMWRPISLLEILHRFGGGNTEDRLPGPFEDEQCNEIA